MPGGVDFGWQGIVVYIVAWILLGGVILRFAVAISNILAERAGSKSLDTEPGWVKAMGIAGLAGLVGLGVGILVKMAGGGSYFQHVCYVSALVVLLLVLPVALPTTLLRSLRVTLFFAAIPAVLGLILGVVVATVMLLVGWPGQG